MSDAPTETTTADCAPSAIDASHATDRESWLQAIDDIGEEAGYFQTLGAKHWAYFIDESPTLLVTFETVDAIRANASQLPSGDAVARKHGWSHLCIIADGDTWYRDPAVYRFFDRQVDDAFFEDFDSVVFYGAGMGGYAACAYCVTAPGATVLAISPRATLDPARVGWDKRDIARRRLDFKSRYGYAPDMTEGAGQVFLAFDPDFAPDAMHATLFVRPWVTPLHTRLLKDQVDPALTQMGALTQMIEAAAQGTLSPKSFARIWRARRKHIPYLKTLLSLAKASKHPNREFKICNNVTRRLNAPVFRKRLVELEAERRKS
jgi:hypothetical protein